MIKVDYEGAWKELKELCKGTMYIDDKYMEILERSHTHNYINLKRRSDKEVADYCLKKYAEMYLELVELKNKLRELSKGDCNG